MFKENRMSTIRYDFICDFIDSGNSLKYFCPLVKAIKLLTSRCQMYKANDRVRVRSLIPNKVILSIRFNNVEMTMFNHFIEFLLNIFKGCLQTESLPHLFVHSNIVVGTNALNDILEIRIVYRFESV